MLAGAFQPILLFIATANRFLTLWGRKTVIPLWLVSEMSGHSANQPYQVSHSLSTARMKFDPFKMKNNLVTAGEKYLRNLVKAEIA